MIFTCVLEPNTVLLVKGAMVVNTDGEASVLGKDISCSKICLGDGKVWPVETRSSCNVLLSTLPQKKDGVGELWARDSQSSGIRMWEEVTDTIFHGMTTLPKSILVVGPTDSGKTTLSTYIINQAIREGLKPAVIDADIGQGDLAPPCTIGCGIVEKQVLDLREVNAEFFAFVGSINPAGYERQIERSVQLLVNKLTTKNNGFPDFNLIVINTDGYVSGNGLLNKVAIANKIQPDLIICLGETYELCMQIKAMLRSEKIPTFLKAKTPLSSNPILRLKAERAKRRSNQFHRYIADSGETRSLSLRKVKIVYKGLVYYKVFVAAGHHLILVRENGTKKLLAERMINMFVGLGSAFNIFGFGIISSITKQDVAIQTNVEMVDTIYLSNIGISRRTWKPYLIKTSKKKRDNICLK